MGHAESHANAGGQLAVAFNARQDPDAWTEHTGPLDTDGSTQAVAYAVRTANTVANGHGISPELAHTLDLAHGQAVCVTGDVTHTLRAEGFDARSEEHTSELQSLMRISYAVFCLKKKNKTQDEQHKVHTRSHKATDNTHIYTKKINIGMNTCK